MNHNLLQALYLKYRAPIFNMCKSFFSVWAVTRIANIHPMNILGVVLFAVLHCFYSGIPTEKNKRNNRIQTFFAALFTLFYLAGSYDSLTTDVDNLFFKAMLLTATATGLFFLISHSLALLIYRLKGYQIKELKIGKLTPGKLSLICFFLCILCRIPYLLYSYPGILTPDSINQFEQVLGMKPFSNHHPWLHTLTISLFYHMGKIFTSDINDAFVFFTVFQICFMALAASYLIYVLSQYVKSHLLLLLLIALYAFLPYHSVMAISIWKDVMFSGVVLFFCASLLGLLKKNSLVSLIIYFISGFFMCLYRSNGWYAFLLTLPFLLYAFRGRKRLMFPLHLTLLFLVLMVKGPVMNSFQVTQPDFVESVSIPLQQVGRVIASGKNLSEHEAALIDKIIDRDYVPDLYTEYISDNMKELVRAKNPQYLVDNKGKYLGLWLSLGIKYPGTYLEAYICQTRGFYSPQTTYPVAEADGIIPNETGLSREYLISGKAFVKLREVLLKLQDIVPLYGSLWSMGSLFWATLVLLALCLRDKKERQNADIHPCQDIHGITLFTLWMPNIAIICTLLLATPVATEFRYAYNLAYCLPFYLGILFMDIPSKTRA